MNRWSQLTLTRRAFLIPRGGTGARWDRLHPKSADSVATPVRAVSASRPHEPERSLKVLCGFCVARALERTR